MPCSMFTSCSYACIRFNTYYCKILISQYFAKYLIDIVLNLKS